MAIKVKQSDIKGVQSMDVDVLKGLKTINQQSIIGEGDIQIGGGGSYVAGDGINIENNIISVNQTVAKKQEVIDESNARTLADNALQEGINQEEIARAEADNTLQNNINNKLDKPNEPVAGQGLNIPYYFDVEYTNNKAIVNDYTVDLLNKEKEKQKFSLEISAANEEKAGLMTAADKQKLNAAITDVSNKADLPSELPPELKAEGVDYPWFMINMEPKGIDADANLHLVHSGYNFNSKQYFTWPEKVIPMAATGTAGGLMTKDDAKALRTDLPTAIEVEKDQRTSQYSQLSTLIAVKQDKLTAGTNITINNNTISATDTTYTAGENITITNNVISAASGTTVVANPTLAGTEAELNGIQVGTTKYKVPDGVHSFPSNWPISSSYTCNDLLAAVGKDSSAIPGKTFQGGIALSDLSEIGLGNAEAEIEIISSVLDPDDKVIRLNVYSANKEPYSWARMYWWQGSAAASSITPWQITARAADQYTNPVATGTVNNTTGVVTFTSGSWTKGIYLISMYGQQGGNNTSRTYYFAYGGYSSWICYSGDCCKSRMSSLNGSLIYTDDTGTGGPNWDADPTIELYKMR